MIRYLDRAAERPGLIKQIESNIEMGFDDTDSDLLTRMQQKLFDRKKRISLFPDRSDKISRQSAVLLPVGPQCNGYDHPDEPCLILNKRSGNVRQAGDLCCPGGGVSPLVDKALAALLTIPFSPLTQWKYWRKCRTDHPDSARRLSVLYATSLRESYEEMRLNPFRVSFLGPLPPQQLRVRNRYIFPMAGWVPRQRRFFPNWEVDKIVYIPMRDLLKPENYSVFRLRMAENHDPSLKHLSPYYPCYLHKSAGETEILWGATYRIVMDFLETVFGFIPPDNGSLPLFDWQLHENYF